MKQQQRGGTIIGFILGLLVGVGAALAMTAYVNKIPVPFIQKTGPRGHELDAAEAERNRNWDPNAPLYGKNPARPAGSDATGVVVSPTPGAAGGAQLTTASPAAPQSDDPLGDLARARAAAAPAVTTAAANPNATPGTTPAAPPAPAATAATGADPFQYFVQAGAFRSQADSDAQRAKLAMLGWEARVTEREQSGRPVFRVRIGPFSKRDDADALKQKLDSAGIDSALVRVQR